MVCIGRKCRHEVVHVYAEFLLFISFQLSMVLNFENPSIQSNYVDFPKIKIFFSNWSLLLKLGTLHQMSAFVSK